MRYCLAALPVLILGAAPALSSSPAAWTASASMARNACARESRLVGAAASEPVRFSDRTGLDVILVTGHFPQKALKKRTGTMLCLFDRRTRRVEVQEAGAWSQPGR